MPTYSVSLTEDLNAKAVTRAKEQKLSVPDYIRLLLRLDAGAGEEKR